MCFKYTLQWLENLRSTSCGSGALKCIFLQLDWGNVPQWGTLFVAMTVAVFAFKELRHNRVVRLSENIINISSSTNDHNKRFVGDRLALKVVGQLEGLSVPKDSRGAKLYWTVRGIHLSHINLIWRVWELADRPTKGTHLNPNFNGWERFAREMLVKKLCESFEAVRNRNKSPTVLAESDLWFGLKTYEVVPTDFFEWLSGLI